MFSAPIFEVCFLSFSLIHSTGGRDDDDDNLRGLTCAASEKAFLRVAAAAWTFHAGTRTTMFNMFNIFVEKESEQGKKHNS